MRIKEIHLHNWGPHKQLSLVVDSDICLIYGPNESGKSAILEAVMCCLCNDWEKIYPNLRDDPEFTGVAVVILKRDNKLIRKVFPAQKKRKQQKQQNHDYLKSSLLFSWAGEANRCQFLSDLLTGLLLPWDLFLWNPLQGLGADDISEGKIKGSKRGKYKEYLELLEERQKLIQAEQNLYNNSSKVKLLELVSELASIDARLEQIRRLKRILAGKIFIQLQQLEQKIAEFPSEQIAELNKLLGRQEQLQAMIDSIKEQIDPISEEQLYWWQSLLNEIEALKVKKISKVGDIGLLILFLLGVWLSVMGIDWLKRLIGVVLVCVGVNWFLWVRQQRLKADKVSYLLKEASKKASQEFFSEEQLREFIALLTKKFSLFQAKKEQLMDLKSELAKQTLRIKNICGSQPPGNYLRQMQVRWEQMQKKRQALQEQLTALGVGKEEMLFEEMEERLLQIDLREEKELIQRRQYLLEQMEQQRLNYETMRAGLISLLGLKGDENLKQMFVALKERQKVIDEKLAQVLSKIVAGIVWKKVLAEMKSKQYKQVEEIINRKEFRENLSLFTNTDYSSASVSLTKDDLLLSLPSGLQYKFSLLSTATRQQLLFAFKTALMERLYQQKCFVFLDDVFIFSDEQRLRKELSAIKDFAEKGWQVIYLSSNKLVYSIFKDLGVNIICL